MQVHCAKCGHDWSLAIALPMELGRFARVLRGHTLIGCPACGAEGDAVLCGPSNAAPSSADAVDPSVSATGATDPGMPDPRD